MARYGHSLYTTSRTGRNVTSANSSRHPVSAGRSARTSEMKQVSGKGKTMEGLDRPPDDSPIYRSEIGVELPVLSLDKNEIVKGLIYSELLAKPKSKRTGR